MYIKSMLALAAILVTLGMTHQAYAQNATNFRHHDHFFGPFGLGVRSHIGLGNVLPALGVNDRFHHDTTTVTTGNVRPDFHRFHDYAFAHRQHFIFLQNRYVLLPETVGCPPGSSLNILTGECVVYQPTIIQQAAPTILSESVQAPDLSATTATLTTTSSVAPTVTCPAGSTLQADNTCTVTTTSQSTVPAIISCPVGTQLQNGQCVQVQQQIVVDPLPCPQCPVGSTLINGQCIISALPSQVTVGTTPNELIILGNHYFHHGGPLAFLR